MTNIPTDLQLQKWQPLNALLLQLQSRMSVFDGGKFILENWACKYIDIRLDMRVGATYARPGSGPDSIYTKLAQAEHERDCAVEEVTRLQRQRDEDVNRMERAAEMIERLNAECNQLAGLRVDVPAEPQLDPNRQWEAGFEERATTKGEQR